MGILVAITSPYEYEARARILSENGIAQGSSGGSLGALGGLLDIRGSFEDQGSSDAGLTAEMYPDIIASEPFLLDLMQQEFFFQEKGQRMTLRAYFSIEQPGHMFSKIFRSMKKVPRRLFRVFEKDKKWERPFTDQNGNPDSKGEAAVEEPEFRIVNISTIEESIIWMLRERLIIEASGRIISLSVKMPEPQVSAELNVIVLEKIIDYVVAYKTKKQRENLQFIKERFQESRQDFEKAQLRLASFRDENFSLITAVAKSRADQLVAEYDLVFSTYKGLAQQREQAEIQLKKDTPLFTEFEPVSVPSISAEPNFPRIILMYIFFGISFGGLVIFFVIIRDFLGEVKNSKAEH